MMVRNEYIMTYLGCNGIIMCKNGKYLYFWEIGHFAELPTSQSDAVITTMIAIIGML